jgi:hypothetical protein
MPSWSISDTHFLKKIKSVKGLEILLNEESYYTFFFASWNTQKKAREYGED